MVENIPEWPQVIVENIKPNWWNEVMGTSSLYNDYFSPELSEADEFTIRGIVHVVSTMSQEKVEWFFEGSQQKERILKAHEVLMTSGSPEDGKRAIVQLIEDYTTDVLSTIK